MYSFLLVIIYISFISLGLPDALFGSAWPMMSVDFAVPISFAGAVSMIISAGTILSGLCSDRLTGRFGAGRVTAVSVLVTALALLGFSVTKSYWMLCVIALPYGLGAGAVDAALNNYVALHYASRHMSWLHCFWGIGASVGPYIMGGAISRGHGWSTGFGYVSVIQLVLTLVLFLALPLWKQASQKHKESTEEIPLALGDVFRIRGVPEILVAFFCYCALEATAGLWASSYLVEFRHIDAQTAASFASLFYLGITAGRFFCGFFADRLGDRRMIRIGTAVLFFGIVLMLLPFSQTVFSLAGLVICGLGAAPVYPSIIHSTPLFFGREKAHAIVGVQMAFAYCGSALMPPLFGLIARYAGLALYPLVLLAAVCVFAVMTARVFRIQKQS